jgi:hypothetical protein
MSFGTRCGSVSKRIRMKSQAAQMVPQNTLPSSGEIKPGLFIGFLQPISSQWKIGEMIIIALSIKYNARLTMALNAKILIYDACVKY